MSSPKTSQKLNLLTDVKPFLANATLKNGDAFLWSPQDKIVQYVSERLDEETGQWSLLHEVAHAILDHRTYTNDFELLQLEVAAWTKAKELSKSLNIHIDDNYIEDCIDTYRDWLHQRSTCPTCGNTGMQHNSREYRCHNCLSIWHVSASRFCRPYRMKQISVQNKRSSERTQTTFQ